MTRQSSKIKVYCYIESRHNDDDSWQYRQIFLFQPNLAAAKIQWKNKGKTDGYKFWRATIGMDYNGPIVQGAVVTTKWGDKSWFNI